MKKMFLFLLTTVLLANKANGGELIDGIPLDISPTPNKDGWYYNYFFNPPANTPGQVIYTCEALSPSMENANCQIYQKQANADGFPTIYKNQKKSSNQPKANLYLESKAFSPHMVTFWTQTHTTSYLLKAEFVPIKLLKIGESLTFPGYVDGYTYFYLELSQDYTNGRIIFELESQLPTHRSQIFFSETQLFANQNQYQYYSQLGSSFSYPLDGVRNPIHLGIWSSNQGEYTLNIKYFPIVTLENEMPFIMKPNQFLNTMFFKIEQITKQWLELNIQIEIENSDERFSPYFTDKGDKFQQRTQLWEVSQITQISKRSHYTQVDIYPFYLGIEPLGNSNIQIKVSQNQRNDLANYKTSSLLLQVYANDSRYFRFSDTSSLSTELNVVFRTLDPLNSCILYVGNNNQDYPRNSYREYQSCTSPYKNTDNIQFSLKPYQGYANYGLNCQFGGQVQVFGYSQFIE